MSMAKQASAEDSEARDERAAAVFATTSWTLVREAARGGHEASLEAWEHIAQRYWRPLYLHCRLRGDPPDVAEDHVQGFFASLLGRDGLAGVRQDVDPPAGGSETGLFRNWLRTSLDHYRRDERRRAHAQKRRPTGGFDPRDISQIERAVEAHAHAPFDRAFDRQWAACVLESARQRLRAQHHARGIAARFDVLWPHVLPGASPLDKTDPARALGMNPKSFANALTDFRQEYGRAIRRVVRETTTDDSDVRTEILLLIEALT